VKKWGELGRQALTIAGLSVKGALSRSQSTVPSTIFESPFLNFCLSTICRFVTASVMDNAARRFSCLLRIVCRIVLLSLPRERDKRFYWIDQVGIVVAVYESLGIEIE